MIEKRSNRISIVNIEFIHYQYYQRHSCLVHFKYKTNSWQYNHQAETPRSYVVNTPSAQVCRNRRHLTTVRTDDSTETSQNENTAGDRHSSSPTENPNQVDSRSLIMTKSRTGVVVNPPKQMTF